jgi:ParB/RepB/Spo0J family partition protein
LDRIFRLQEETQFLLLRTNKIFPNPYQPREEIDLGSPEFEDLKKSVAAYGVLVPIIVSNREGPLVLVAGQRRLACCRQVGSLKIPAIVRSLTPQQIIEISYLENLHRKNFSSVEMAQGFQRLRVEMAGLPAEELCRRIGRSPEAMKKDLEIAALPMILREAIKRGLIGEEHALKLRGIHDEVHLLEIIKRVHLCRLSVEDTDHLANPGRA